MSALVAAAGGLPLTCHRAFDAARDRDAALEELVALGVSRVLTSGGAPIAAQGTVAIARLLERAAGRIIVIAGGTVRARNVQQIVARTGVTEVHAHVTTTHDVRGLVANLDAAASRRR
jgi:copper homeostasis protein